MASERSGSNLLATLLDANKHICSPSPLHLIRTMLRNRHKYGSLNNDNSWKIFVQDCVDLILASQTQTWTNINVKELLDNKYRTLSSIIEHIYKKQAKIKDTQTVVIKENETYMLIPFIEKAFPGSKYLWLTRDPRDMASSHVTSPGRTGGVAEASRRWFVEQRGTRLTLNSLFDLEPQRLLYYFLRYEDMILDPARVARELCTFIKVPFEESMLDFYRQKQALSRANFSSYWENVSKPMITTKVGRFNDDLSPDEIRYIEKECSKEMEHCGYTPKYNDFYFNFNPLIYQRSTSKRFMPAKEKKRQDSIKQVRNRIEKLKLEDY